MTRSASRYSWAARGEIAGFVPASHRRHGSRAGPSRCAATTANATPASQASREHDPEDRGARPRLTRPAAGAEDDRRRDRGRERRPAYRRPRRRRAAGTSEQDRDDGELGDPRPHGEQLDAAGREAPAAGHLARERRDGNADRGPAEEGEARPGRDSSAKPDRGRGGRPWPRAPIPPSGPEAGAVATPGSSSDQRSPRVGRRPRRCRRPGCACVRSIGRLVEPLGAAFRQAAAQLRRPIRRRARRWYSGPCLRGSAYSFGLSVQYVPLDVPYQVPPRPLRLERLVLGRRRRSWSRGSPCSMTASGRLGDVRVRRLPPADVACRSRRRPGPRPARGRAGAPWRVLGPSRAVLARSGSARHDARALWPADAGRAPGGRAPLEPSSCS